MADQTISYKGHTILIKADLPAPEVFIDGKSVTVRSAAGGFFTPAHAYQSFASLDDLARTIIDSGMA